MDTNGLSGFHSDIYLMIVDRALTDRKTARTLLLCDRRTNTVAKRLLTDARKAQLVVDGWPPGTQEYLTKEKLKFYRSFLAKRLEEERWNLVTELLRADPLACLYAMRALSNGLAYANLQHYFLSERSPDRVQAASWLWEAVRRVPTTLCWSFDFWCLHLWPPFQACSWFRQREGAVFRPYHGQETAARSSWVPSKDDPNVVYFIPWGTKVCDVLALSLESVKSR